MMPTEYFLAHIWLIPLFPLAGAALMLLIGRRLPNSAVNVICVGSVFLAMCYAFGAIWQLVSRPAAERLVSYNLFTWVPAGMMHTGSGALMRFNVPWGVLMDPLTCEMLFVVTGVGFLIHVYSTGYMAHEGGYYRFFGYLNLFMFSMLTLVLANNLLLLFVGWEGVGLCSYLLIGFYFLRKSASDAGKKAFIVNRIGDAGFLLGLFLMLGTLGTIQFTEIGPAIAAGHFAMGDATLTAIAILLFVGATGKSAQLPLYVWLPDAMEAPDARQRVNSRGDDGDCRRVFAGPHECSSSRWRRKRWRWLRWSDAVTSISSRQRWAWSRTTSSACWPYSTVSQLGYMFLALWSARRVHSGRVPILMTHAFFKAFALLLGSGSVIHSLSGEQDMRKMGALCGVGFRRRRAPFVVASIAIAGIPPLAGFFSKDAILGHAFEYNKILWLLGFITAGMTAFYMFRLVDASVLRALARRSRSRTPYARIAKLDDRAADYPGRARQTVGGWIGWPGSLGGGGRFSKFLEPVMVKHVGREGCGNSRVPCGVQAFPHGISVDAALRARSPAAESG